jgi:hypothetical protein
MSTRPIDALPHARHIRLEAHRPHATSRPLQNLFAHLACAVGQRLSLFAVTEATKPGLVDLPREVSVELVYLVVNDLEPAKKVAKSTEVCVSSSPCHDAKR